MTEEGSSTEKEVSLQPQQQPPPSAAPMPKEQVQDEDEVQQSSTRTLPSSQPSAATPHVTNGTNASNISDNINTTRATTTMTMTTTTTTPPNNQKNKKTQKRLFLGMIPLDDETERQLELYAKGAGGVVLLMFLVNPVLFVTQLWNLLWTVVGVTLGLGFGSGLGLHVYQQLQTWQKDYDHNKNNNKQDILNERRKSMEQIKPHPQHHHSSLLSSSTSASSAFLEDGNSYWSLMAQAGYPVFGSLVDDPGAHRILRGQVIRKDHVFWQKQYRFTDDIIPNQRAVRLVQSEWPALPPAVTREIGRFMEHIMRDYIAGWYSILDQGVSFRPERDKRAEGIPRDGGGTPENASTSSLGRTDSDHTKSPQQQRKQQQKQQQKAPPNARVAREMVFSTLTHRRAPMVDTTYRVLSAAFGNIASRAEHVNILELVVLKWTQVLGHSFKEYRTLRKAAQEKNATEHPSEVQITREFLLAGKVHGALIFGLDVPSLLFADASGEECGVGSDQSKDGSESSSCVGDATRVLERRLYDTNMIRECMNDYNRVVANRLVRALLPKSETASNCVMSLVVEIFAGCVLQPLMNLWVPSFLNDIIVKAMTTAPTPEVAKEAATATTQNNSHSVTDSVQGVTTPVKRAVTKITDRANDVVEEAVETAASLTKDVFKDVGAPNVALELKESVTSGSVGRRISSSGIVSSGSSDSGESFPEVDGYGSVGEKLLTLSSLALADLSKHIDFDAGRSARLNNQETGVDWDDADCQSAILRLVLVIEAVLLQGRTSYRDHVLEIKVPANGADLPAGHNGVGGTAGLKLDQEGIVMKDEWAQNKSEKGSFTRLLMEMTSDMNAFAEKISAYRIKNPVPPLCREPQDDDFEPDQNEIHTIRTLISTWLHTGQLYKAMNLICMSSDSFFSNYYANDAFIVSDDSERFLQQMRNLEGVDVMVETMAVLSSPPLDLVEEFEFLTSPTPAAPPAPTSSPSRGLQSQNTAVANFGHATESLTGSFLGSFGDRSIPRFLDFGRNAAFAASLRAERERRTRAWEARKTDDSIHTVIRKTAQKKEEFELHRELHNLARVFFNGTNILTVREAARRADERQGHAATAISEKVSIMTVETASNRRKVEVPDDDSSFLLRAQSRPLNPISVHRDDRNHDLSYKCFLATYEEPAIQPGTQRYNGGRFLRRCFLQYYPSDRTSSIVVQSDARKLDRRKSKLLMNGDQGSKEQAITPHFPATFLRQRHLCQKWLPTGTTQSFLTSNLMETTDFIAAPRTGKALDFVYRMSLFDRPIVDLSGKRFTVQDSSTRGVHRADASSMEMSDASLSYMLYSIGKEFDPKSTLPPAETAPDGYPMIFYKINTKNGDQTSTEIKPYRLSFVRAAIMVTSARQEAQLQSLVDCVKAGSAKSQNKARTDERLRPTLKILDYANDRSQDQSKASCLNRDLKLGIYHIDRDQLRRNGLVSPRFPTSIIQLGAKIEATALAKEVPIAKLVNKDTPPDATLYRIRCAAVIELEDVEEATYELEPYALDDGSFATFYREEWVIYRTLKDFQALHKQLKSQVASTESSMSTSTRIVGAATAALGTKQLGRRNKKILIPSLAQATKVVAITTTKKAIEKRMELLDEYIGYLLGNNSLMNRNSELLLFLGASHPFPSEVTVTKAPANFIDPLGRMDFIRSVALRDNGGVSKLKERFSAKKKTEIHSRSSSISEHNNRSTRNETNTPSEPNLDTSNMDPSILAKVDQVPLPEVRNRIFELMRYSFGFENASFVRSQMLSMLETASFVAMAKQSNFRKVLYDFHVQKLNGEAIGGWIRAVLDILWPDGVWGTPAPVLTKEEEAALMKKSREKLHEGFPEQFRTMLGKDLTKEGLDMIHEMLQNRIVVKSLFYMLFDLLWIEVFPELRDSLPCASALDLDLL